MRLIGDNESIKCIMSMYSRRKKRENVNRIGLIKRETTDTIETCEKQQR